MSEDDGYSGPFADLATVLRMLRAKSGLSQEALAERAGCSAPNLSRYEKGKQKMEVDTLDRLLRELDADLGDVALLAGQAPDAKAFAQALDELRSQVQSLEARVLEAIQARKEATRRA